MDLAFSPCVIDDESTSGDRSSMRASVIALGLLAVVVSVGGLSCRPNTDLVVAPLAATSVAAMVITVPAPRADGRLSPDVSPRRYRLSLEVDSAAKRFRGEVRIDIDIARPTTSIILHASGLSFDEVEVRSGDRLHAAKASLRAAVGAEHDGGRPEELVIESPDVLSVGAAELRIAYQAPLDEKLRGIYRTERDGRMYVVTQMEPADARRVLPCFDDPTFKTPFEVSVIAPRGQRVFANGALLRERDAGEDPDSGVARVRFDFAATRPLPTYLLALAVGPFDVLEGPTRPVPVRLIAPSGLAGRGAFVVSVASELTELFARRFGTPYPYAKLDLVAVPNFASGAMENAGLLMFREELLLVDSDSSASARRRAIQVIAHELAHQWFGDLVTPNWWNDLWLNEGFANYFEAVGADELHPETRSELGQFARLGAVMALDSLDAARQVRQEVRTVYEAEEAFDAITYSKGSAIIGMLAAYLGAGPFRAGIQSYLSRYAHGNASAEELFRALGDASGSDISAVARSFVEQPGVPLVSLTSSCVAGVGKVVLEQRRHRLLPHAPETSLWNIPVCLRYAPLGSRTAGAADVVETSRVCVLFDRRVMAVPLEDCPAWIQPNEDHRGYYRYALTREGMAAAWQATLMAGDARGRIGFLANAWALVQSGDFPANEFLALLESAKGERDPEGVFALVELYDRVEVAFVTSETKPAFDRWVSGALLPLAKELGWAARPGDSEETKLLRETVLDALSLHTNERWLKEEGARRAMAYLRAAGGADADSAGVALRVAVRTGDVSFDALVASLRSRSDPEHRTRILRALGAFSEPKAVASALDLVLSGAVKPADFLYIARGAAIKEAGRDALSAWLEAHLVELAAKSDGMHATGALGALGRLCSADARTHAEAVFRPLVSKVGGSQRRLDEALEASAACADLRGRQAAAAGLWLSARP